ncbi:hypothetical protein BO71DRAFT_412422 [Aspergillus ellipticus CBS 707.79]|uniref:Uncharacterized protein n=1 Tax=Aspergillus ellipticus CBS 707.79 TaxID=1448320 RepID=A0A319CZL3_9EURO|nr:hypothetical protein BO71DRAFT_412422 [Aspergillus ellipticus CBS 707.79]
MDVAWLSLWRVAGVGGFSPVVVNTCFGHYYWEFGIHSTPSYVEDKIELSMYSQPRHLKNMKLFAGVNAGIKCRKLHTFPWYEGYQEPNTEYQPPASTISGRNALCGALLSERIFNNHNGLKASSRRARYPNSTSGMDPMLYPTWTPYLTVGSGNPSRSLFDVKNCLESAFPSTTCLSRAHAHPASPFSLTP